jgi:hypothetical protein
VHCRRIEESASIVAVLIEGKEKAAWGGGFLLRAIRKPVLSARANDLHEQITRHPLHRQS